MLIEQGFYGEAKKEIARLALMDEGCEYADLFERWNRFVDGRMLDEHIHGGIAGLGTDYLDAGTSLRLDFEILSSAAQTFTILEREHNSGSLPGDDRSRVKIRITEFVFDALGSRRRNVIWRTRFLSEELLCEPGRVVKIPWTYPVGAESSFALKLVRLDAVLYPSAALLAGSEVPIRPLALGSLDLRVYPPGWRALRADPWLALRASCLAEEPIYDRHALIAASLLERGGEIEKAAFAFLTRVSQDGSPRARAKADAALAWLRLDPRELWQDAQPFALPSHRGERIDLPRSKRG